VPNRRLRWSRNREGAAAEVSVELTGVFLDMDHRQAVAQAAVAAASALHPDLPIADEWARVQDACYAASASYLLVTTPQDGSGAGRSVPDVADTRRQLDDARHGIDTFYARHRRVLDSATAAAVAAVTDATDALSTAHRTRQRLEATDPRWREYPSVQTAHNLLEAACSELEQARDRGDLAATLGAITQLKDRSATLNVALDDAPARMELANRTFAAVRTRADAARTRAGAVGPALSALLREFHAHSSADLLDNELRARRDLDHADALLEQALTAVSEQRPETALELAAQARTALSTADGPIDSVTERLTMLRRLRENPREVERATRFRLRDTQRLAVDRGATEEWGSVLDAQVGRIDRTVAALAAHHPDYWRYHLEMQEIADFVNTIVDRIRQGSAR
jgi:hypothetical protein